jgi:hypothetical protein
LILAKDRGIHSLGCIMSRHRHVHDCGADFFARTAEFAGPLAFVDKNKSTQCRQINADTGSGGTEVKNLKWIANIKQFCEMSTSMLKIALKGSK